MTSMFKTAFSELSVFDKVSLVAFYTTIILLVVTAVIAILIRRLNKDKANDYFKLIKGIFIGFAIAFISIMLTLKFDEMVANDEFVKELFYPIASVFVAVVLSVLGGLIVKAVAPNFISKYRIIALAFCLIPVIVTIVFLSLYYKNVAAPSGYYTNVSTLGLVVSAVLLIGVLFIVVFFFGKRKNDASTKAITYAAVSIALSFALSYIRLFRLPQSGSVTFASLLPLMVYSYMFGIKKGVVAGLIYGVLQAVQDPWIIHPAQFLLDYPIAFGMIGLSGVFREREMFKKIPSLSFALGGIISVLFRYLCHAVSGIFAFSSYAPEQFNAVAWGFLYNSFTLADMAICIFCGGLLFASKSFSKLIEKVIIEN